MLPTDPEFDEQIEQALASYADPADTGHSQLITARVLTHIESGKKRRRHWKTAFIFVVPELALLLLWVVFLIPHRTAYNRTAYRSPAPHRLATSQPAAVSPEARTAVEDNKRVIGGPAASAHAIRVEQSRKLAHPKLDRFPVAAPPSEQEQLLISFHREVPLAAQQTIANSQQRSDEPLHIAMISIPYIDPNLHP